MLSQLPKKPSPRPTPASTPHPTTSYSGNYTAYGVKQKMSKHYKFFNIVVFLNYLKGNSQTINSKAVFVIKYRCFLLSGDSQLHILWCIHVQRNKGSQAWDNAHCIQNCMRHWETDKVWCKSLYTSQPWKLNENHLKNSVSSVQFSRSVMSDSLRPHESQHTRPPPCPSPTPRVHSDS